MMTNRFYKTGVCGAIIVALSACSGGGDAGLYGTQASAKGEETVQPVDKSARTKLNNDYARLQFRDPGRPTLSVDLPRSGTATYNGVAGFTTVSPDTTHWDAINNVSTLEIAANTALTVYFGSNELVGSMWNFRDTDGKLADGNVQLAGVLGYPGDGEYDRSVVKATGSGLLDWGDHEQDLSVSIELGFITGETGDTLRTPLAIISTIEGEVTEMTGAAYLENDNAVNPVMR